MFKVLAAIVVLGFLFSYITVVAAEKEDQFPIHTTWVGKGQGKDAKGVEHNRGGFELTVTGREGRQWEGTLSTISEGRSAAAKVEVAGTVSSTNRVTMNVTKAVQGAVPDGFLEAKFTGKVEGARQLTLRADHGSGAYVELQLTRQEPAKQ